MQTDLADYSTFIPDQALISMDMQTFVCARYYTGNDIVHVSSPLQEFTCVIGDPQISYTQVSEGYKDIA